MRRLPNLSCFTKCGGDAKIAISSNVAKEGRNGKRLCAVTRKGSLATIKEYWKRFGLDKRFAR